MIAIRWIFLVLASLAMIWHATASARQAYGFFRSRDFANVARRLLVTTSLGVLGGGMLIFLLISVVG